MVDNISDGVFVLLDTQTRAALSCSGSAFPPSLGSVPVQISHKSEVKWREQLRQRAHSHNMGCIILKINNSKQTMCLRITGVDWIGLLQDSQLLNVQTFKFQAGFFFFFFLVGGRHLVHPVNILFNFEGI